MTQTIKVALIQLYAEPLQAEKNFAKAENFIRSAASQGARLAALPEYHLSSWEPKEQGFLDIADQWRTYLEKYCDLAKELHICIVPGTIIQREKDPQSGEAKLYNVAYFIDDTGKVVGKYAKKNIWHPERAYLTSSTREPHEAFDTPIGKVGLLICWDLSFPEAFRELIAQGAKIIIIPTFWGLDDCSEVGLGYNPRSEMIFLESTLITRAFENTCAVIFVNAGGPPGEKYAGLSQVTVPFVGSLARLGASPEGMLVVDLDMTIVDQAEDHYKVRKDLAREDWHYDYRHSKQ